MEVDDSCLPALDSGFLRREPHEAMQRVHAARAAIMDPLLHTLTEAQWHDPIMREAILARLRDAQRFEKTHDAVQHLGKLFNSK